MGKVLAVDIGASNGRLILTTLRDDRLEFREISRFANGPVLVNGHYYTDILQLLTQIKQGLKSANLSGDAPDALGIDTWGADYGLLDAKGFLIENPTHYRDSMMDVDEWLYAVLPFEKIYEHTGIQALPCDTLRQLFGFKLRRPDIFEKAQTLLFIPNLLNYFLSGKMESEITFASTSGLLNVYSDAFDDSLIDKLVLPAIMPPVGKPGTIVGPLLQEVRDELNVQDTMVVNVAAHDTASAVVAVPCVDEDEFMFISSGTWIMLGVETRKVCVNSKSMAYNISNEKGYDGTIRLLRNCSGLWILQECIREWEGEGELGYERIIDLAERAKPHISYIDVTDKRFFGKGGMPGKIRSFCEETRQPVPETKGEVVRTIFESLTLECLLAAHQIEELRCRRYERLFIVGGGSKNAMMCQLIANATDKKVFAGPAEATALGNALVQLLCIGEIKDTKVARTILRDSIQIASYTPQGHEAWADELDAYLTIKITTGGGNKHAQGDRI